MKTVDSSTNGLAIFACSAADLFETIALQAPIDEHRLYISNQPHLYPLARLADDFPRYAVLLADTHLARLFVVAANRVEAAASVEGIKTKRHKAGGWSQARFQRHVDNDRAQHAKEVVAALTRLVHDEELRSIVIAGDEVVVQLIRQELPKELADRVVDVVKLDIRAPEHQVLEVTAELMRQKDAESDRERVDALFDAYRGSGLGVVGSEATARALDMGQVEELLIAGPAAGEGSDKEHKGDELIAKARQTAARVTIVQDAALLADVGGVGAILRFKL